MRMDPELERLLAELLRSQAVDFPEGTGELRGVGDPDRFGRLGDRNLGAQEQSRCAGHATIEDLLMEGIAGAFLEEPAEVSFGQPASRRHLS